MNSLLEGIVERTYMPHMPRDTNAAILDFGCGEGWVLSHLYHKHGYRNLVGVEVSAELIAQMDEPIRACSQLVTDSLAFLKTHREAFDCIIAKQMVYYFPKQQLPEVFAAFEGALKPGGVLFVEVYNGAYLTATYTESKDPGIQCMLNEISLRKLIMGTGLTLVELSGMNIPVSRTVRGFVYSALCAAYRFFMKAIVLAERGIDAENPKIWEKSIIAVAKRPNV